MKKRISALLLAITLLGATAVSASDYQLDINSATAVLSGEPQLAPEVVSDLGTASVLNGTSEWYIENDDGLYRIWLYVTPALDASSEVVFRIRSEYTNKTVTLDLSTGNMGWREVSLAQGGRIPLRSIIDESTSGKNYFTAIRYQGLDIDVYADLLDFTKVYANNIILATKTKTAYKDGVRVYLKNEPIAKNGDMYIAYSDLSKFIDAPLPAACVENTETIDGVNMVNFTKVQAGIGNYSFAYNDELTLYSNVPVNYDKNNDKKVLKSILNAVRLGE